MLESSQSANRSVMGKIYNNFIRTFNNQKQLPKWVVIITESDLIENIGPIPRNGRFQVFGELLRSMMQNLETAVNTIQQGHPQKAIKYSWPHFLWVEATLHNNYQDNDSRIIFNKCLQAATLHFDRMIALPLKQEWDEFNCTYFNWHQQKYTAHGLSAIWKALDNTMRFADTKLMRNHGLFLQNVFQKDKILLESTKRDGHLDQTSESSSLPKKSPIGRDTTTRSTSKTTTRTTRQQRQEKTIQQKIDYLQTIFNISYIYIKMYLRYFIGRLPAKNLTISLHQFNLAFIQAVCFILW